MNRTLELFFSYLTHPRDALVRVLEATAQMWPDKLYLSMVYRIRFGRALNLSNPSTFNEKLNWLKLYNRDPKYSVMADKFAAKQYVSDIVGDEFVVKNLLVSNNWQDIDFDKLPEQFVIKCTHDSGGAFVCRSKGTFDYKGTQRKIEKNFRTNYFYPLREWPYKNIKPQIIVDRYLDDHTGNELRDYKWWCFNGKPTYMYCTIKGKSIFENFYDMDFNPVAIDHGFPRHKPEFERPDNFELMKELAAKLSKGIPFVRIDFFDVDGQVYFGEFTFYDWGGMRPFRGDWDLKLGSLLSLPINK